jgi:hypothetical protein
MDATSVPFCLHCGYDRAGQPPASRTAPCPECGNAPDPEAAARALAAFHDPVRRGRSLLLGRVPPGWWCLLPPTLWRAARVQRVLWLTITTLLLASFFFLGGHIRYVYAVGPAVPVPSLAAAPPSATKVTRTVYQAIASGLVPADANPIQPTGASSITSERPHDNPEIRCGLRSMALSLQPRFLAGVIWSSCIPAAGLLALRFVALPIILAFRRQKLAQDLHTAAIVAADATVAATAIASTLVTVAIPILVMGAVTLLPISAADALVRITPTLVLTSLVGLPPLLFATAVWRDHSRRVFPIPVLAAALLLGSYALGLGVAMGLIAATFAIASR